MRDVRPAVNALGIQKPYLVYASIRAGRRRALLRLPLRSSRKEGL